MAKKKRELGRVEVVRKKISELVAAKYNPRTITAKAREALENSLKKFGLVELIVWNRRTKRVVGGHQRLTALRAAGAVFTDVSVVDLPPIEEKALNLALNNPALGGEFTAGVEAILEEIRLASPATVDELLLDDIEIPAAESEPPPGDAEKPTRFSVLIECVDAKQQKKLLERFAAEGLKARKMGG